MLFSSTTFLFVFLPLVCLVYLIIKPEIRNYWLLLASMFFYGWGEPRYLAVMLFVIAVNYCAAGLFERFASRKKLILGISVAANLGILIFFKYTNFLIENINFFLGRDLPGIKVVMPIGISFFIFQAMSYLIDVYRGNEKCQKDIRKLALYISFFPQLIAGPIVKYHEIIANIDERSSQMTDIVYGVRRFIIGLSKKVLLANTMGSLADSVYQAGPTGITPVVAWLGAVAYSLQIFYDFSGYSDMAIGIGRIFGFHFSENFNYPYIAASMTDFWRRWHISLSSWFKEYLYIPLGGNRCGKLATQRNLFCVFLATGIWHGASWNFIVWGLWHGMFIMAEKYAERLNFKTPQCLRHLYVILVFVIGWVFFRADNLHIAVDFIKVMFGMGQGTPHFALGYYLNAKNILVGCMALFFCIPWKFEVLKTKSLTECAYNLALLVLLFLSVMSVAASTYNPFIYFRF